MVVHKKSDYGFNGYRAPEVPQTSRPIRKKRSNLRRNLKTDPMSAIDMLATVAGMLLEKGDHKNIAEMDNDSNNNRKSLGADGKPINVEQCYQASCDEGDILIGGDANGQTTSGGSVMSGSSSFVKVEEIKYGSEEVAMKDGKMVGAKIDDLMGKSPVPLEDGIHMDDMDGKPPALVSSDSSADVPYCRDNAISCNHSYPLFIKDGKERDQHGDDEENSSGCTHLGPIVSEPSRFEGDERGKKVCNSKFWKVGPTLLKDGTEFFGRDVDMRFRSRKMCCKRQRTQRSPFNKVKQLHQRNIAECKPVVENGAEDGGSKLTGNGMPTFMTEPKTSVEKEDCRVKLRIKSFKIPELSIEMPENATIARLKRAVLETVTAMVENGLGVGVTLQGKKIRDDSRTLEQAGITHGEKLDSLGFTLEPTTPASSPIKDTPPLFPTCESPKPLARLPALLPTRDAGVVINSNPDANDSPCALGSSSIDQHDPNPSTSKALVPAVTSEPLALVPLSGRKPRKTEVSQRRIRRPFSVPEVEALVRAVEELGTGRWRDVKLRAFDDAKHRTYVDLKDKWKTLVHTARISPQQRRGEPVPQELLDRVLTAHAYWSQHQAKLQVKPAQPKMDRCPVQL